MALDFRALQGGGRPPTAPSVSVPRYAAPRGADFDMAARALQFVQQKRAMNERRAREEAAIRQPRELMRMFQENADQFIIKEKVSIADHELPGVTRNMAFNQIVRNQPSLVSSNEAGKPDYSAVNAIVDMLYSPQEVSRVNNAALDDFATGLLEEGRVDSKGVAWYPEEGIEPFLGMLAEQGLVADRGMAIQKAADATWERLGNVKRYLAPMTSRSYMEEAPSNRLIDIFGDTGAGDPSSITERPAGGDLSMGGQPSPSAPFTADDTAGLTRRVSMPAAEGPTPRTTATALGPGVDPGSRVIRDIGGAPAAQSYPFTHDLAEQMGFESIIGKGNMAGLARLSMGDTGGRLMVDIHPGQYEGEKRVALNVTYRDPRTGQAIALPQGLEHLPGQIEQAALNAPNFLYELLGQAEDLGGSSREQARKMGQILEGQWGRPGVLTEGPTEDTRRAIQRYEEAMRAQQEVRKAQSPPPDPIAPDTPPPEEPFRMSSATEGPSGGGSDWTPTKPRDKKSTRLSYREKFRGTG